MCRVATPWWLGQIALHALQRRPEFLPTSAALTLALLALPGAALLRGALPTREMRIRLSMTDYDHHAIDELLQ